MHVHMCADVCAGASARSLLSILRLVAAATIVVVGVSSSSSSSSSAAAAAAAALLPLFSFFCLSPTSSHGCGKLGDVENVFDELEKTRLAAAEVNDGEDWNCEVGVPPPFDVLFSNS